jgi:hypothetical protein
MPSRWQPKWDGGIVIIVGTVIITATIVTGTVGKSGMWVEQAR